jgi:FG-GAP-like repeat
MVWRVLIAVGLLWSTATHHGWAVVTFTDASVASGITTFTRGRECTMVDYDRDGDLDIMVWNNLSGDDQLYRNDGSAHFVNVAVAMGINGAGVEEQQGGGFADYNNDGFSDVYVPNLDRENQFFKNSNGASFQEISSDLALDDQVERRGVAWADIDTDSLLDFYVGTIPRSTEATAFLAMNDMSAPFTNEAALRGLSFLLNDQSPMWFDWGDDNDLDLFIGAFFYYTPTEMQNRLFENNGLGLFTDVSSAISTSGEVTTGAQLGDFDGDGRLDIFVLERETDNVIWRDNGDGTFTDIAPLIGLEAPPDPAGRAGLEESCHCGGLRQ